MNDALTWNFRVADEHPVISPDSDNVSYELGGDFVAYTIADTLLVEEPLAEALVAQLSKTRDPAFEFADDELHIEAIEPSAYGYTSLWEEFSNNIKYGKRYFDEGTIMYLERMLMGADEFVSVAGHPAIRTVSPGDPDASFFRARHANTDPLRLRICLAPHVEVGPPPRELATPGRMNPVGISVFYGSFDAHTCVCEIRAPVGSIAAVAAFTLLRPIRVLDLTVFDEGPEHVSYYDRTRLEKLGHMIFLSEFHQEMRRPILPQDETIDYIPTQVVAEYLAHRYSPNLDGLIYSSALTTPPGRNIVLFADAARVASPEGYELHRDAGPQVRGWLEGGLYIVDREVENATPAVHPGLGIRVPIDLTGSAQPPEPPPTIAYVDHSLSLAEVRSITVATDSIPVISAPRRSAL